MQLGRYYIEANWGHLAFATLIFGLCAAYLFDVILASTDAQNLLLPLPATVLAGVLYLSIVVREPKIIEGTGDRSPRRPGRPSWPQFRTPIMMALVGAYLLAISWTGFDVSTFLFIAAALSVQGERRLPVLLGYSAIFAVVVVLGMKALLPYPLPTLIL